MSAGDRGAREGPGHTGPAPTWEHVLIGPLPLPQGHLHMSLSCRIKSQYIVTPHSPRTEVALLLEPHGHLHGADNAGGASSPQCQAPGRAGGVPVGPTGCPGPRPPAPCLRSGWFYGERLRDGETGWFPEDFARCITSQVAVEGNVRRMERLRVETDV